MIFIGITYVMKEYHTMELKKLEYLESVYRLRNFTKAAEEQFISQPSISTSIQSLEDELGIALVNRNTRPLSFTNAGEEFMTYVYRILKEVQNATNAMKLLAEQELDSLRVAVYSSPTSHLIHRIYIDFLNHFPQYTLSLHEFNQNDMLEQLYAGNIDIAYTLLPENLDNSRFKSIPITQCELCLMLSNRHHLSGNTSIALEQLSGERIYTYPPGSLVKNVLDREFIRRNISVRQMNPHRFDMLHLITDQNHGIAFILKDEFIDIPKQFDITVKPLKQPIFFRTGLLLKKDARMTPAMKDMTDYLKTLLAPEHK